MVVEMYLSEMGHESMAEACLAFGLTNGHTHGSGRASGLLESCSVDRTELTGMYNASHRGWQWLRPVSAQADPGQVRRGNPSIVRLARRRWQGHLFLQIEHGCCSNWIILINMAFIGVATSTGFWKCPICSNWAVSTNGIFGTNLQSIENSFNSNKAAKHFKKMWNFYLKHIITYRTNENTKNTIQYV